MMIYIANDDEKLEYLSDFVFYRDENELKIKSFYVLEQQFLPVEEQYVDATEYFLIKSSCSAHFYIISTMNLRESKEIVDVLLFDVFSIYDRKFHSVKLSSLVSPELFNVLKEKHSKLLTIDANLSFIYVADLPLPSAK